MSEARGQPCMIEKTIEAAVRGQPGHFAPCTRIPMTRLFGEAWNEKKEAVK